MKVIYLWGNSNLPEPDKWVEFDPIKAAYVEDEFISACNEVITKDYYYTNIRKDMFLVLTESSFFSLPYIASKKSNKYLLKSLVSIKKPEHLDYEVEVYSDPEEYSNRVNSYTHRVILDDVIVKSRTTTDTTVELLYYPKEIIDVIHTF